MSEDAPGPGRGSRYSGLLELEVRGGSWRCRRRAPLSVQLIRREDRLFAIPSDAGGGMRGGDESRLSLKAKEGARVSWLPPTATLFHAAAAGPAAPDRSSAGVCDQALEISATGKSSLVFTAKPGVPCRGSRVRQRVRIGVETGCELLYLEYWTVGRAAGGELWRFDWIDADLEYREGDRLQYAEKWRLSRPMEGPALLAGCPMWATGIAHGDRMEELLRAEMEELRGRGGEAEIGRLGEKSWLLKARSTQAWDPGFNP